MSVTHGQEKFRRAIEGMAVGRGGIKQRLADAWTSQLVHINTEQDIPQDHRERFRELRAKITRYPGELAGEGSIQASIRHMSEDEAVEFAKEIVAFHHRLKDLF